MFYLNKARFGRQRDVGGVGAYVGWSACGEWNREHAGGGAGVTLVTESMADLIFTFYTYTLLIVDLGSLSAALDGRRPSNVACSVAIN